MIARLALCVVLFGACSADASAALVRYSRSGGIAGEMTTMKISQAGRTRVDSNRSDPRRFTLSEARLKRVRNVLREADFASLDSSYEPDAVVNDGITVSVTYAGYTVSASTGGDPPERFERVLIRLGRIANG